MLDMNVLIKMEIHTVILIRSGRIDAVMIIRTLIMQHGLIALIEKAVRIVRLTATFMPVAYPALAVGRFLLRVVLETFPDL